MTQRNQKIYPKVEQLVKDFIFGEFHIFSPSRTVTIQRDPFGVMVCANGGNRIIQGRVSTIANQLHNLLGGEKNKEVDELCGSDCYTITLPVE